MFHLAHLRSGSIVSGESPAEQCLLPGRIWIVTRELHPQVRSDLKQYSDTGPGLSSIGAYVAFDGTADAG